jgi:hypothetical protein
MRRLALACLVLGGCSAAVRGPPDGSEPAPDLAPAAAPDLLPGCVDQDQDGYGAGCLTGPDCDDADPDSHPGAREICDDGRDNDCSGAVDEAGCGCRPGETRECYGGAPGTAQRGICRLGLRRCLPDGSWSDCQGEVRPRGETCDGLDDDCDGDTDENVTNACGACGPVSPELCGDGLDNDCNGVAEEGCGTCDPGCLCAGASCTCRPPTGQPCYDASPRTAGVGLCRAGVHDCVQQTDGTWRWGPCVGQVVPATPRCDGQDHDCDGAPDDGPACPCTEGAVRACSIDRGTCRRGRETCSAGQWGACSGVQPAAEVCDGLDNDCDGLTDESVANACGGCGPVPPEVCGDGLDNDCDGEVDESAAGCTCPPDGTQACYRGPADTRGKGECKDGVQACRFAELLQAWGPCSGDVLPGVERCGDGKDNDCDGAIDEDCGCPAGAVRPCGSDVGGCKKGTQTCTAGAWGDCAGETPPAPETCDGADNDCDGLVDEGVLNACGRCPPEPCFVEGYTPGSCAAPGRTCAGVEPHPQLPGAITLAETTNLVYPYIYLSVTNKAEVAQLDTDTGIKRWQKPSWGLNPSRTAVALDGSVWVGNRCLDPARDNDFTCSSLAHLDRDGALICRADVPGWVRGVAIDGDGNAWAGTWNGRSVYKVSGTQVDQAQSPPRCTILGSRNLGVPIYGLAVDGRGFLWTASNPSKKVDTRTLSEVASVAVGSYYGIAIDRQHRVWLGGWSGGGNMHRLDGDPPFALLDVPNTAGVTAVTVHPDGSIWGSSFGGDVPGAYRVRLDAAGAQVAAVTKHADPSNFANHGIAVDRAGKLWSPQVWQKGRVNRWRADGTHEGTFIVDDGQELYTYSDMTGIQLRTITVRDGHWFQDFDSGYARPVWDRIEWTAQVPLGTAVEVQARAADAQADFAAGRATAWCGPFSASPAALAGCPSLSGHRWLQLDVRLSTTADGVRPAVSDVKVYWSY